MTIRRRAAPFPDGSFERLRSEGLRHLQALCGHQWTDYNVHDPGITMLEAFCFALTDLAYRADAPMADLMTGEDGRIDFVRQALHPPDEAFACRPTTPDDLRLALLDAVPIVGDLLVNAIADAGGAPRGRYRIDVQPAATASAQRDARTAQCLRDVAAAYRRMRGVGEDVQTIEAVVEEPCRLVAEIEIDGARDPVDILAEIADRCQRMLSSPVGPTNMNVAAIEPDERPLDERLDGPRLDGLPHARAAPGHTTQDETMLFVGDLGQVIADVEGVANIDSLRLAVGDGAPQAGSVPWRWRARTDEADGAGNKGRTTAGRLHALRLTVPDGENAAAAGIALIRRGHLVSVSAREVAAKFIDLQISGRRHRLPHRALTARFPLPQGRHLPPASFPSAQLHFPAIYGLNRFGVPESASDAEKAAVRQAKAYLALGDQALAHAATQVRHARELFSPEWPTLQSYWWQMLGEEELPGIETLYNRPPLRIVEESYAPLDHFYDRKNRALDYLLALYGETYTQGSLRKFCPHLDERELRHWLLKNKTSFVKRILLLGRDRVGGFDYGAPSWEHPGNCAGLQIRIGLLLGFDLPHSRSLTRAVVERHLVFAGAIQPDVANNAADNVVNSAERPLPRRAMRLPLDWPTPDAQHTTTEAKVKTIFRKPGLGALLYAGVSRDRYRLLEVGTGPSCELLLDTAAPGAPAYYDSIAYCSSREEAIQVAARLRDSLLGLNRVCEGLHLVEHCLLRPIVVGNTAGGAPAADDDFYVLRASVVLPAWTARTRLEGFRQFAEETVTLNGPAHVRLQCLWLDFAAMCAFESDYREWLDAKMAWCDNPDDQATAMHADSAAAAVVRQLLKHGADRRPAGRAS